DILWNNKFTKRLANEKSVPNYHEFTYEVYFYGEDLEKSQALEFDINQFFNGMSFIWGHECRIAGGHEWDTWDNVNKHWVKSGSLIRSTWIRSASVTSESSCERMAAAVGLRKKMAIDSSDRHLTEVHYTLSERIDQHPTRMLHSQRSDPHRSILLEADQ